MNVSSKRIKTIWNPSKKFTDFRLNKQLALAIRQLGNSGESAETVLEKMYRVITSKPELVKQIKGMSKYDN